jgi:hypothetical protein
MISSWILLAALSLIITLSLVDPIFKEFPFLRLVAAAGWGASAAVFWLRNLTTGTASEAAAWVLAALYLLICLVSGGHPTLVMDRLLREHLSVSEWNVLRNRVAAVQGVTILGIVVIAFIWTFAT